MNYLELQQEYPTVYLEVALSKGVVKYENSTGVVLMKVKASGVFLTFGRWNLTRGEDVAYPEEKFKGKLVPYKYGTNFKTIDIALEEYKKWEEEFVEEVE